MCFIVITYVSFKSVLHTAAFNSRRTTPIKIEPTTIVAWWVPLEEKKADTNVEG